MGPEVGNQEPDTGSRKPWFLTLAAGWADGWPRPRGSRASSVCGHSAYHVPCVLVAADLCRIRLRDMADRRYSGLLMLNQAAVPIGVWTGGGSHDVGVTWRLSSPTLWSPRYFPQGGSEPLNGSTRLGHPTRMWYVTRHHMAHRPRGSIGPRWERGWRQWGCHLVESVASSDHTGSAYVCNCLHHHYVRLAACLCTHHQGRLN
jgi:hypothetical protein